jgi:hypothetical protein
MPVIYHPLVPILFVGVHSTLDGVKPGLVKLTLTLAAPVKLVDDGPCTTVA